MFSLGRWGGAALAGVLGLVIMSLLCAGLTGVLLAAMVAPPFGALLALVCALAWFAPWGWWVRRWWRRRLFVGPDGLWLEHEIKRARYVPFARVRGISRRPPARTHVYGPGAWWNVELRLDSQ